MSLLQKMLFLSEQAYLDYESAADLRHEYVDGQLYAMAGAGERHNRITLNIAFQLRAAARGGPCGVFVNDMKLKLTLGKAYYYPDVMLVCNSQDGADDYKEQPCFIAEVLSPSTMAIDKREKLLAYQKIAGLRYYLLVSSDCRHIEYFVRDAENEWQTALLEAEEALAIVCDNYQTTLTLNNVYEDVVFES
ncbi:MAG: Uma2 family endonuclease [Methylococcales bacterium]